MDTMFHWTARVDIKKEDFETSHNLRIMVERRVLSYFVGRHTDLDRTFNSKLGCL